MSAASNTKASLSTTPLPPYYAVVFASVARGLTENERRLYDAMASRMVERAKGMQGFLGVDSARGGDGIGITVSYWESEDAIAAWKADSEHAEARALGRSDWYAAFTLRVAKVERAYGFSR